MFLPSLVKSSRGTFCSTYTLFDWFKENGIWLIILICVITIIIEVNSFIGLDTNKIIEEQLKLIRNNFIIDLVIISLILILAIILKISQVKKE